MGNVPPGALSEFYESLRLPAQAPPSAQAQAPPSAQAQAPPSAQAQAPPSAQAQAQAPPRPPVSRESEAASAGNVGDWWEMDGKIITIEDSRHWEDKSKSFKNSNCNNLVVVEFCAQWSGPSRFIRPFIENLAKANKNVLFLRLNYDSMEDVASKESVDVVPTFLLYKGGQLKEKIVGARRFDLSAKINELK